MASPPRSSGKPARFRRDDENGGPLFSREDLEAEDGDREDIDFPRQDVNGAGQRIPVGVLVGAQGSFPAGPLVDGVGDPMP